MHSLLYEHSTQPYLHEFGHHARVIKLVLSKDLDVERTDPDWGLVPETIKFRDIPPHGQESATQQQQGYQYMYTPPHGKVYGDVFPGR